jgi:hypothetical protein
MTFKAHVRNGRLLLDEPTDLPEGAEIELTAVHDVDDLDEDDRRRLHEALDQAAEEERAGLGRPAGDVLAELRRA